MRLLFITPLIDPWELKSPVLTRGRPPLGLFVKMLPLTGHQPPYGVLYLIAVLKRAGHEARFIDGTLTTHDELLRAIAEYAPAWVGLSSTSRYWRAGVATIELIRRAFPALKIMVGGSHASALPEEALADSPAIDAVFVGEAEESLLEFLAAPEKAIPGVVRRANDAVHPWTPRPSPQRLDDLPFPDRSQYPPRRYRPSPLFYKRLPHTALFGSRGCPYGCSFCHSNRDVRFRGVDHVMEEIRATQRDLGIREYTFYDETITIRRPWILDLCERMRQAALPIGWSANARVDGLDREVLAAMKAAGCWKLLFGLESGVQKHLDALCKGQTLEAAREGVRLTNEAGLEAEGCFMLGIPDETPDEARRTIRFALELPLAYAGFSNLMPFPGTAIFERVRGEPGFQGYDHLHFQDLAYVPRTMTRDQLASLLRTAYRRFYVRPSYWWSRLRTIRTLTDAVRHLRGLIYVAFLRR